MKSILSILSAGMLACLVTSCDWENSHSDRIDLKNLSNVCSTTDLTYEGDKILTATLSFGNYVSEVKNFFYIHGQLTSVKTTSADGHSGDISLLYGADGKLKREIDNEYFDGLAYGGIPMKYAYVKVTDFLYDGNGNIATVLITQKSKDQPGATGSSTGRQADDELKKDQVVDRYDYTWSKGNVVKEVRRMCDENGACGFFPIETTYNYDNKRNLTNQQLVFRYIYYNTVPFVFSRNNLTQISTEVNGQSQVDSWVEFHYNKRGYPSEYNFMSKGSTPNPFTLEYR
jgi:hypothetical protein